MLAITTDLDLVKSLTTTLIDSANGFREAAEDVKSDVIRSFLLESAESRDAVIARLQDTVLKLGGELPIRASLAGDVHQAWLKLRSALDGGDERAILDEVIFGEEYLQQKFEDPLKDSTVKGWARKAIEQAFESICDRYLDVIELKRSLEENRV